MINDLIKRGLSDNLSEDERYKVFRYLRHIPNARKTDEEWELYLKMGKEKGMPTPNRESYVRPLHEKQS